MLKNFSLKAKMCLVVSLLVAESLSLTMFFAYCYLSKQFKEVISRQQFTMVSAMAEEIDAKLASAQSQLVGIAGSIPPDTLMNPQKALAFLRSRSDTGVTFDNALFLLSPKGRMISITPFEAELTGKDYAFRDYFKKTFSTLKPQISQPILSTQQHGHPVITLTAPILDDQGRQLGVLAGEGVFC
jgi:two-component system NtrC family sensor kinase